MRFGKRTMFFAINGAVALGLIVYFLFWLLAPQTIGTIQRPVQSNVVDVAYHVKGQTYRSELMRSGIPYAQKEVTLRYVGWQPQWVRVNSFMGFVAEPLAWWLVLLLASAMLLLTNNSVFSKGTVFQLHKGFPWLTMDEYFPEAGTPPEYTNQRRPRKKPVRRLRHK